ncbi:hypothetical protein ABZT16_41100 [Streptomyces flaveolus]|nr:hypothetical protein [Streptomyces antibioticus]
MGTDAPLHEVRKGRLRAVLDLTDVRGESLDDVVRVLGVYATHPHLFY